MWRKSAEGLIDMSQEQARQDKYMYIVTVLHFDGRARGDRGSGRVRALRDVLTCCEGAPAGRGGREGQGSADRLKCA